MDDTHTRRWAVTGAAGTIGRALRAHLAETSVELVSIDVSEITRVGRSERLVRCDIGDLTGLESAFEGCEGVVHLAGIADEADFHDLAEVNIVGTYHVLEAARRAGVGRVVYASSNRLTGSYPTETLVDEAMPPRPDGFYGVSKVAGEALCRLYTDKFDLSTIALRIGTYEPAPGSAREMRTWLSPGDALRAFDAAMTTPQAHTVFYAVSNNTERWWSLEAARAAGFEPSDDAAAHGSHDPLPADQRQGGMYATPEYSLDRMRSD
ncbi:NAD(P)-dependent oxidoreductase [Microbacterium sp. W4I20]|uniref:NAD-dependent epimerase/dehydratase family protein n=1 Tax=Microbacterium sp. W4I20 TaxID=3042262 RepID=UPI002780F01A|nr:NAD(P)-dependent oxidoreductase [Microbacterium sp. W4I20]MDQ0725690.1 uronate dehydrogenase [Microbacterium sp. W4I20]